MMTHRLPIFMTPSSWLLLIFLLIGAGLRFHGLAAMDGMLHHDEAYNGLDALALVDAPELRAFFPANTGREGLYYYPLALGIATLGDSVFTLRLVSAFIGILSLAATYALAAQMFNRQVAVWVVGVLAVLYWSTHLSHLIFRAGLVPLLGALSLAALLSAQRSGRRWIVSGLLIGLTLYTYTAARAYVGYMLVWLAWWALRDRHLRRGAIRALCIAVLMSFPLLVALQQPGQTTASIDRAAADSWQMVLENTTDWLAAFTQAGDPNDDHNLPDRPILDLPLTLLALAGFIGVVVAVRQRWLLLWWAGLVLVALAPTVLSIDAPHYLRGVGLLLPLALFIGTGAWWIARFRFGWVVASSLIVWAGWNTYVDFGRWLDTSELGIYIDERVNRALADVQQTAPTTQRLSVPGFVFHPVIAYRAAQQNREVVFFEWPDHEHTCFLAPDETALYLDLPIQLSHFERRASAYLTLTPLVQASANDYNLYRAEPSFGATWDDAAQAGDLLWMQATSQVSEAVSPGDTLTLTLALRMQRPAQNEWRIFAHLQGDPTPYEGGTLWADGDAPLCALAAQPQPSDTTLLQQIALPLPADLSAGAYHIALGLYNPTTGERLPLRTPTDETRYYEAVNFAVE